MSPLWHSTWLRVVALETVVVLLGTLLLLGLARVVNIRAFAQQLVGLLTLP
ncbi:MAG TPA: hypothetical protein VMU33_10200 [Burkholderiaceae bacterium]|nr:hypothetical protein [Burkholderiaceae bacterium]